MSSIYTTSEDAEEAFYDAMSRGDLDTLMGVWADDEEIVCIHPTGQCLTGHRAIRESWQEIFSSNTRFSVRIKHSVRWKGALLAVHSVVEYLYVGDEPTPHGPMLSTNVFQRGAHGWRLLSRHTSAAADNGPNDLDAPGETQSHTLH